VSADLIALAEELDELPYDWHGAGSVARGVLAAIIRNAPERIEHTAETGAGRSTVLFSQLSPHHTVFAIEWGGSISQPQQHSRLRAASVEWVIGPTQQTLVTHEFAHQLDIVLLDGPHGYPWPQLEYAKVYPTLRTGSLLIVDDIQIPTIRHLFDFLREDDMFELIEVVSNTAFFRRTDAPTFPTDGDHWWLQKYNKSRYPLAPPFD
jgi:hypothetical protein